MSDFALLLGDICKPCQCSGNINPDDPGSCDTASGDCLRCLNNTFGKACSLCAPGYFGDAVVLKDCQSKLFFYSIDYETNKKTPYRLHM